MIALALMLAQAGANPVPMISGFGMGGYSCARAFASENLNQTQSWIFGFWSGVNNTRGLQVGSHTDGDGVLGEVRRVCASHPATLLYVAAEKAYANLHRQGS